MCACVTESAMTETVTSTEPLITTEKIFTTERLETTTDQTDGMSTPGATTTNMAPPLTVEDENMTTSSKTQTSPTPILKETTSTTQEGSLHTAAMTMDNQTSTTESLGKDDEDFGITVSDQTRTGVVSDMNDVSVVTVTMLNTALSVTSLDLALVLIIGMVVLISACVSATLCT